MGNINSIKNIVLFCIKNGYREVHLSVGKLPLLISDSSERTYLQGVVPVSKALISSIKNKYLDKDENTILTISDRQFLLMKLGDDLVFRHLPYITAQIDSVDTVTSACYNNSGIILTVAKEQKQRFHQTYNVASYIANNRRITLLTIEKNKFFSLKSKNSKIINIYKPHTELDVLLRITEQISYDCLLVPNCLNTNAIEIINNISQEKLVIVGTNWETAKNIDQKNISYILDIDAHNHKIKKAHSNARININTIIENLRG